VVNGGDTSARHRIDVRNALQELERFRRPGNQRVVAHLEREAPFLELKVLEQHVFQACFEEALIPEWRSVANPGKVGRLIDVRAIGSTANQLLGIGNEVVDYDEGCLLGTDRQLLNADVGMQIYDHDGVSPKRTEYLRSGARRLADRRATLVE